MAIRFIDVFITKNDDGSVTVIRKPVTVIQPLVSENPDRLVAEKRGRGKPKPDAERKNSKSVLESPRQGRAE
jgi:hypothetical protein